MIDVCSKLLAIGLQRALIAISGFVLAYHRNCAAGLLQGAFGIRGSYGSFNITSTTDSIVFFERPYSENGRPGKMYGWINRISGETEFHGSRKGETGYFIVYQLNCKPAQAGHRLC